MWGSLIFGLCMLDVAHAFCSCIKRWLMKHYVMGYHNESIMYVCLSHIVHLTIVIHEPSKSEVKSGRSFNMITVLRKIVNICIHNIYPYKPIGKLYRLHFHFK